MNECTGNNEVSRDQYRFGFGNFMDSLWDQEAEKYKVLCRMVHVTKAALQIGYMQLLFCFVFSTFFAYHYLMAISGNVSTENWINQYTARSISQLLLAISLQVIIILVMIHGVRVEQKSLLVPYIIYASVTVLVGFAQIVSDMMNLDKSIDAPELYTNKSNGLYPFMSHIIGTMIQAWCLGVVWRCYGFIGEKKVARQIKEQLSATHAAFCYPEQLYCYSVAQPPPYADTVMSPNVGYPYPSMNTQKDTKKTVEESEPVKTQQNQNEIV